MAKKKVKKHEYTGRKNENEQINVPKTDFRAFNPNDGDLGRDNLTTQATESVEIPRAHQTSAIFIHGCRVFIRNLTDQVLLEETSVIQNELYNIRRQLDTLENLHYQMCKERNFRGI